MYELKVKRVYEEVSKEDGYRILVDRLWPRGISKAKVDFWLKDIAPSTEVRKWYGHVSEQYSDFRKLYEKELDEKNCILDFLNICKGHMNYENVTLLYAANSVEENNAIVLRDWILKKRIMLLKQQKYIIYNIRIDNRDYKGGIRTWS